MKNFNSIAGMVAHLAKMADAEVVALQGGLKKCAIEIEKTSKAEIGQYQDEIGPFAGWVELADTTKEDRVRKGFSENDPLLRSGELRDSLGNTVAGMEAVV